MNAIADMYGVACMRKLQACRKKTTTIQINMQTDQEKILENCKSFLANGEAEIALETLLRTKISENEIIVLFNRWNTLKEQLIKGIIKMEDYNLEKNKIVNSTLELIEKIKKDKKANSDKNSKQEKPKSKMVVGVLPEITNGSTLVGMIQASDARWEPSTDSISDESEAELIGEFLSEIQDYTEYTEVVLEIEPKHRIQTELNLNKKIKELNENGFRVFGEIRKMVHSNSDLKFNSINICIMRADNEKIVKNENGNLYFPVAYAN